MPRTSAINALSVVTGLLLFSGTVQAGAAYYPTADSATALWYRFEGAPLPAPDATVDSSGHKRTLSIAGTGVQTGLPGLGLSQAISPASHLASFGLGHAMQPATSAVVSWTDVGSATNSFLFPSDSTRANFTLEAWVKIPSIPSADTTLLSVRPATAASQWHKDYVVQIAGSGNLSRPGALMFADNGDSHIGQHLIAYTDGLVWQTDTWYHVAIVVQQDFVHPNNDPSNTTSVLLYRTPAGTTTTTLLATHNNRPHSRLLLDATESGDRLIEIGGYAGPFTSQAALPGQIDEFRYSTIARGATDFQTTLAGFTYDTTSMKSLIQPMQHSPATYLTGTGLLPLLTSAAPLPSDDTAASQRLNGTLQTKIDDLWSRGVAPQVNISGGTINGAIATGLSLQDAGLPIHLRADPVLWITSLTTGNRHWPWDFWSDDDSHWFTFMGDKYPVYPKANPSAGYNAMLAKLQALQNGGIASVSGMWMDYEGEPNPWNTQPASQNNGIMPDGVTHVSSFYTHSGYDSANAVDPSLYPGVLGTDGFKQYAFALRDSLLEACCHEALIDTYGSMPSFSNYQSFFSSIASPYIDSKGSIYPVNSVLAPGTVASPSVYANNFYLPTQLGGTTGRDLNQANADSVYWYSMLKAFSTSAANRGSATNAQVPYVSAMVTDYQADSFVFPMTDDLYRELLRHLYFRGATGTYVFNAQAVSAPAVMVQQSFADIELARSVLDEMISFRDFIVHGTPMTYDVQPMFSTSAVWSGMAYNGKWLVRVVSRSGSNQTITIPAATGVTFDLVAPPEGATYLLAPGVTPHRVDFRPATAHIKFENGYQDAGNNLDVSTYKYQPVGATVPDPIFSTTVPGDSIVNGVYGMYANPANEHSAALSMGTPASGTNWEYKGSGIAVANTSNLLNAPSFTAEAWVNIQSGTPDNAAIISKGVNPGTGGYDWTLKYRSTGQVEIMFSKDAVTTTWIRTAGSPLASLNTWHHIAFSYDGQSRQATLYVDYAPMSWTAGNGILPWDFMRHTGDKLMLGFFNRGINALFDEFRFTPEVLDAQQFLHVGPIH